MFGKIVLVGSVVAASLLVASSTCKTREYDSLR